MKNETELENKNAQDMRVKQQDLKDNYLAQAVLISLIDPSKPCNFIPAPSLHSNYDFVMEYENHKWMIEVKNRGEQYRWKKTFMIDLYKINRLLEYKDYEHRIIELNGDEAYIFDIDRLDFSKYELETKTVNASTLRNDDRKMVKEFYQLPIEESRIVKMPDLSYLR